MTERKRAMNGPNGPKKGKAVKKRPPNLPQDVQSTALPVQKPKQKQLGKSKAQVKLRAKKIAAGLIAGKTAGDAIRAAGYSESVAQNPGMVLQNPLIKKTYCEILDAAGVTDAACAQVLADAMRAMRTVSCVSGKDAGSGSVDFVDVEDHQVRLKAVDQVHKVRRRYGETKIITGPDGGPIIVKSTELSDEELSAIAGRGRPGAPQKAKGKKKPA